MDKILIAARLRKKIRPIVARFQKIMRGKYRVHIVVGFSLFVIALIGAIVFRDLPSPTKLKNNQVFSISSKIYDRNGALLYEIYEDKNRTPIVLKDLPPYVYQASIAIEDQNFYKHIGFDVWGMFRAALNTVFRQKLQGGSTITQQLVKTTLLDRQRTLTRKAKEAVLTFASEVIYSKQDILEMYMNNIPYGGTAWGIEAAAHTYFNTDARNLSLAQAALLAGLPQSPTRYSPFGTNPQLAKDRQLQVLRRMAEDKYITQEQADKAGQEPLVYAISKTNINAPHFVMYIRDQLVNTYGETVVARGGLRVYTTLDLSLHQDAQASLSAELTRLDKRKYKVGNGAALVTSPKTGEILAMIGSRDFFDATHDGQVNITLRERQPGSSIKPINVVTGFQLKKLTPGTMILDIPTCFLVGGQAQYCPKNYDGVAHGPVQTRFFLGNSYNIPEIKVISMNTLESVVATASAMGITTWKDPSNYGLSLALGGGEVKMVDMAVAFGTLANEGIKVPLHSILRVEDFQGNVLEQYKPEETAAAVDTLTDHPDTPSLGEATRVLDRQPAYLVSHILLDNSARIGAFGPSSELVIRNQVVSAKTGTTNDLRDNWTIGYTPEYVTTVWVGNNDNTPMNQALVSGITGAAPIWNDIMSRVLRGKKPVWPALPPDIISKEICTVSGLLPNPDAQCSTRTEFFWKGTEPAAMENISRETWIVSTTGLPPKEGDPTDNLVLERHTLLSDPFTHDFCLDCVRPVDDKGKVVYEQHIVDLQKYYAGYDERPIITPPPKQQ